METYTYLKSKLFFISIKVIGHHLTFKSIVIGAGAGAMKKVHPQVGKVHQLQVVRMNRAETIGEHEPTRLAVP